MFSCSKNRACGKPPLCWQLGFQLKPVPAELRTQIPLVQVYNPPWTGLRPSGGSFPKIPVLALNQVPVLSYRQKAVSCLVFVLADNNTISELSSLHEEDSSFRQSYRQMRNKQFPVSGDLESNPDYWSGVTGGSSGASRGPAATECDKEGRESFRHRCGQLWQGSAGAGHEEPKAGRQDGSEAAVIREHLCLPV